MTQFNSIGVRVYKILTMVGVPPKEVDRCMYWAFGKGVYEAPIYPDWIDRWNHLHKEVKVMPKDSFTQFVAVVGTMYLLHKKKKQEREN